MRRFETAEASVTRASFFSCSMSAVGTASIICTSPASSAATRAAEFEIMR